MIKIFFAAILLHLNRVERIITQNNFLGDEICYGVRKFVKTRDKKGLKEVIRMPNGRMKNIFWCFIFCWYCCVVVPVVKGKP